MLRHEHANPFLCRAQPGASPSRTAAAQRLPCLPLHQHPLGRQRCVRPCEQRRLLQLNAHLIEQGVLDIHAGGTIGLVIETQCNYFAPLAFPQTVEAGIRVAKLGGSSVRYEVGLFAQGEAMTAAAGHFVHVYVDRDTRRPVPVPAPLRAVLEKLLVPAQ